MLTKLQCALYTHFPPWKYFFSPVALPDGQSVWIQWYNSHKENSKCQQEHKKVTLRITRQNKIHLQLEVIHKNTK